MAEVEGIKRDCPRCGKRLKTVAKAPRQMFDAGGSNVTVPLAAWLYECAEDGQFVINTRGDVWELD